MALIEAGHLHRVAVVVEDVTTASAWFTRVLGAGPLGTDRHGNPGDVAMGAGEEDLAGTDACMLRVGGYPFILLAKGEPGGPVDKFFQRYGPSVQSLAWEVDDMWVVQNLLLQHGVRVPSVSIAGRHFFMHPKDTHGVLMEWTDDSFGENVRRPGEGGGTVEVAGLAWVTAAVADAAGTAAFLTDLCGAELARRDTDAETVVDVQIGDSVLRLVTPGSAESWYAPYLDSGPRLASCGLRVADLDAALEALAAEGVATVSNSGGIARTDPATTCGIPFEWTA
ncbi:MAG TPA: VOC family protein [Mycobacteriales bacterium]|nr:VOC family protein [Mycobacteriales bacterium]